MPARTRAMVAAAAVTLAVAAAIAAADYVADHRPHAVERTSGDYIHAHARPGDTQYVLYARASVLYHRALPTPFPTTGA